MKTLKLLFVLGVLMSLAFMSGCTKDPVEPPQPSPTEPTVVLKTASGVVFTSDTVKMQIHSTFYCSYVISNLKSSDESYFTANDSILMSTVNQHSGQITLPNLLENQIIHLIVNKNTMKKYKYILVVDSLAHITLQEFPTDTMPYGVVMNLLYTWSNADSCVVTDDQDNSRWKLTNLSGIFTTPSLKKTTTFYFSAFKNGVAYTAIARIKVYSVITTFDRLNGTWTKTGFLYQPKDSIGYRNMWRSCNSDDSWVITKNSTDTISGKIVIHQGSDWCWPGGEVEWQGNIFLIANNQLDIAGLTYNIIELTSTKLVLTYYDFGAGGTYKIIFEK